MTNNTNTVKRYPMPMPFGWFAVSYSDELAPSQSRAVHYFGQELVLFRTEAGKAVLMEAYCPHLGAHLGHGIHEQAGSGGGRIEGNNIVCPFHSWKFSPEGECVEVPYAKNMPPKVAGKKCLKSFPIRETNQVIWAWYHPDGVAPLWEVISHDEANSDDWSPQDRYEWIIHTHPQEMAENAADPAHFKYVHGTASFPEWETTYDGYFVRGLQVANMPTPRGEVKGSIRTGSAGPGQGFTKFEGIADTFLLGLTTPIDEHKVQVRFAFIQPKINGEVKQGGVNAAIIANIVGQLEEDKPIWENKIYRPLPILCDGDGPIAKFRKWYSQFYAEGFDPRAL
ncbi:putative 3-ketosteroid-9-alpha-monooxygenase, oxygenase component [Zhongshania aliphaticivorans]|uniref:cholesterol 7-desaturase n=1 Tax=Zhongshania aliphaticivorans TaxID=1470434 RepID=A0A5S9Q6D6_9GAMM|nr:Rieske 2Fe-2S domain-containing protein [Zhongshania aliphaticivorans]CAA0103657.1 putative 3-ketosteroid-9-alpha-monooxygenase, oxygenase component [Zhongshania aliphaticivorans]CAA0113359.1 putative 3-ketosteroid-9-alpha-monooxygenase, oxygenase component [Zhongshania aliphaticivorans]